MTNTISSHEDARAEPRPAAEAAAEHAERDRSEQRRIVVGIDGSARGTDAVRLTRRLSAAADAVVVVASVCPVDFYMPSSLAAQSQAQESIERLRPEFGATGLWRHRVIEAPSPARGLHELAEREAAELIVLGSTHHGPMRRVMLGGVAGRLLHGAPCAVAIAPRDYREPPPSQRLIVGVGFDGTPESWSALHAGARWARELQAQLRIVTALQIPDPANPVFGAVSFSETLDAMRTSADTQLEAARAAVDVPAGVVVDVREGEPARVLADESTRLDLLLVGSRGYGPLRTVLLGGVSGPVAQGSACPVMVMPRGAARPIGAA